MPHVKAWEVCLSAASFFFYIAIFMFMFNSLALPLSEAFMLTPAQLGKLSAIYLVANVIFLLPAGMLLDRYPIKRLLMGAFALAIVVVFLLAHAANYRVFIFLNFILGIAGAFCFLGPMKLVGRWFEKNKTGLITAVIVAMAMLGGMVAQTPLLFLVNVVGWRHALIFLSVLGVLFLLLIMLMVEEVPHHATLPSHPVHGARHLSRCRGTIFRSTHWLAALYTAFMNLPIAVFAAEWGLPYLMHAKQVSALQASFLSSLVFFGMMIGAPVIGWLSDKYQRCTTLMVMGALLGLMLTILLMLIPSGHSFLLGVILFLLGASVGSQTLGYAFITRHSNDIILATAMSLTSMTVMALAAFAQPLFGYLLQMADKHSATLTSTLSYTLMDYQRAMLIFPLAFIFALSMGLRLRKK